jgi:ATP-dependent Clp protease ATP-binding subunit ClpC
MFERLTERARRALFFARDEASQLGSTSIDTEHLLLGFIREGKGLTRRLFADAGIGLDEIRDEVLRRVPAQPKTSTSAEIPFSAAAERVRQHAAQEADRLLHDYVGTEHLLLGLLSEGIGPDDVYYRGERDADFGEMLRRVVEKVNRMKVASPAGVVPEWSREIPGEIPAIGGTEHAA